MCAVNGEVQQPLSIITSPCLYHYYLMATFVSIIVCMARIAKIRGYLLYVTGKF